MKQKWTNYTFSPGAANAGTVTLTGLNITLDQILLITDTTRNVIIYNFADATAGESAYAQATNSVLTLTANTTGYSSTDKLLIYYDDNISPATLSAGENHMGEVGGKGLSVSASFTRPADTTAYAVGDVVSNSTSATTLMSFAIARVNAGTGYITGARIAISQKSVTPRFRVHLFNTSNPTVAADNSPNKELFADESKVVGIFDLPAIVTPTDATNSTISRAFDYTIRLPFKCAAGSNLIYAYIETLDAYTPASAGTYTLTLLADLD
jgi:hypothetical protein